MLNPLTIGVLAATALLALAAVYYLVRDALIDDRILLMGAVLELGLIVQLVVALVRSGAVHGAAERATFIAYACTLPVIPIGTTFLAIKEKTRWSMGVVAGGAFAIAVMTGRLAQIWSLRA